MCPASLQQVLVQKLMTDPEARKKKKKKDFPFPTYVYFLPRPLFRLLNPIFGEHLGKRDSPKHSYKFIIMIPILPGAIEDSEERPLLRRAAGGTGRQHLAIKLLCVNASSHLTRH